MGAVACVGATGCLQWRFTLRQVHARCRCRPHPIPRAGARGRCVSFVDTSVAESQTSPSPPPARSTPYARWLAQALGLLLFHLVGMGAGSEEGLWLPALGLGIALVSWFGWWYAALLAVDLFVVRWGNYPTHPLWLVVLDSVLLAAQIAGSWWCFSVAAQGSRWLDDPRSATVFLLIVPGVINAGAACFEALIWSLAGVEPGVPMWTLASAVGIGRALGILTLAPALLVLATPLLAHGRLLDISPTEQRVRRLIWTESTW